MCVSQCVSESVCVLCPCESGCVSLWVSVCNLCVSVRVYVSVSIFVPVCLRARPCVSVSICLSVGAADREGWIGEAGPKEAAVWGLLGETFHAGLGSCGPSVAGKDLGVACAREP